MSRRYVSLVHVSCVVLLYSVESVHGLRYSSCSLQGQPIEQLARNPDTGAVIRTGVVLDDPPPRRLTASRVDLETNHGKTNNYDEDDNPITGVIHQTAFFPVSRNTLDTTDGWFKFYGRECLCADVSVGLAYCAVENNVCWSPWSFEKDKTPVCVSVTSAQSFSKAVMPVICITLSLMIAVLFLTNTGRGILDYGFSCCVPGWQRFVANRIADRDPVRARRLLRSYALRRQVQLELENQRNGILMQTGDVAQWTTHEVEETPTLQPTKLALKTRIFNSEQESGVSKQVEDENDDLSCVICFSEIECRERVGVLSCRHIFHVDCLKSWLVRKNSCPLCQQDEAAKPLYDTTEATSEPQNNPNQDEYDTTDLAASR